MKVKLRIQDLASDGSGVGLHEGKVAFVPGALPEEEVLAQITRNKKTYMRGTLLGIEKESPHRVPPPCPYHGVCGGCPLQHASMECQLAYKEKHLKDVLRRIARLDVLPPVRVIPSPQAWHYRNKMIFPVRRRAGASMLGFYQARSHDFVPIEACLAASPGINAAMTPVNRAIALMEPYDEGGEKGLLRHVILRSFGTEPPQATFVLFRDGVVPDPGLPSLWRNLNPRPGNVILGGQWEHVKGYALQETRVRGRRHLLHPGSFFQANTSIMETVLDLLESLVEPSLPLLDLYGGAGFFGLQLARKVPRVTVVENNPLAVRSGRESLEANGMDNVRIVEGAAEASETLFCDSAAEGFQVLIDPPRTGVSRGLLDTILKHRPDRILYLSCHPASFARDAATLTQVYALQGLHLLDFFPQTAHAEALGVFYAPEGVKADVKIIE